MGSITPGDLRKRLSIYLLSDGCWIVYILTNHIPPSCYLSLPLTTPFGLTTTLSLAMGVSNQYEFLIHIRCRSQAGKHKKVAKFSQSLLILYNIREVYRFAP